MPRACPEPVAGPVLGLTPTPTWWDPDALAALAGKYRTLASLRRAKAGGAAPPGRETFRDLARRFPGALRELDTVRLSDLDARAEALEHAARGPASAVAPWMGWCHGYHAWMRAALYVKARVGRVAVRAPDAPDAHDGLAGEARARTGLAVDAEFVRAVAAPPGGRITPVVIARVAREYGGSEAEVRVALFPPRVAGPDG